MDAERAHHCLVRLTATGELARVTADGLELTAGPSLVDARRDWWLASELLVAAVSMSMLSAVADQARRERLAIGLYSCVGEAVVHEDRPMPLGRLILRVCIEATAEDLPRLDGMLRRAKRACVLGRVLAVPLELQLTPIATEPSLHV